MYLHRYSVEKKARSGLNLSKPFGKGCKKGENNVQPGRGINVGQVLVESEVLTYGRPGPGQKSLGPFIYID